MSYAKNLEKHLGGKWTYRAFSHWTCDDGVRSVSRCSAGVDEWDNEVGPAQCWLYGDGKPRRAEAYMYDSPCLQESSAFFTAGPC